MQVGLGDDSMGAVVWHRSVLVLGRHAGDADVGVGIAPKIGGPGDVDERC